MEGDKAGLPCCNLQAEEREITHLTSFFSPSAAAGGASLVVSAADMPLDPPPPPDGMKPDPTLIKPHLNAPNKPRYISERLAAKPLAVVS